MYVVIKRPLPSLCFLLTPNPLTPSFLLYSCRTVMSLVPLSCSYRHARRQPPLSLSYFAIHATTDPFSLDIRFPPASLFLQAVVQLDKLYSITFPLPPYFYLFITCLPTSITLRLSLVLPSPLSSIFLFVLHFFCCISVQAQYGAPSRFSFSLVYHLASHPPTHITLIVFLCTRHRTSSPLE